MSAPVTLEVIVGRLSIIFTHMLRHTPAHEFAARISLSCKESFLLLELVRAVVVPQTPFPCVRNHIPGLVIRHVKLCEWKAWWGMKNIICDSTHLSSTGISPPLQKEWGARGVGGYDKRGAVTAAPSKDSTENPRHS